MYASLISSLSTASRLQNRLMRENSRLLVRGFQLLRILGVHIVASSLRKLSARKRAKLALLAYYYLDFQMAYCPLFSCNLVTILGVTVT